MATRLLLALAFAIGASGYVQAEAVLRTGAVSAPAEPLGTTDARFLQWAATASAASSSPANVEPGDYARQWSAPDGRRIALVVKVPHPRADAPSVQLPNVPAGADARPYFEKALVRVRAQRAGRFVIPPGTYTFKSLASAGLGHLILKDLADLDIEGTGATLLFTQNQPGITINRSKRLRISGLTLDYTLRTSSLGVVVDGHGTNTLIIDPKYPVGVDDAVHFVSEYDVARNQWVQGGKRAIMPPESASPAVRVGEQAYRSATFEHIEAGRNYVVFHHWYGGAAIRIDDTPGPHQSEDIVIDTATVHSAPGMGILVYGLKRGLAVVNSRILPRPDGSSPVSAEYDAIHVQLGGGDILIDGNHIVGQGDDGINLSNPVHPIVTIADNGRTVVLSKYSRHIRAGDSLAFFDEIGSYLGQARVAGRPTALGGLNNQIVLDRAIPGLTSNSVVRDIALISSRFDVSNNIVEACNCHGVLVQLPNGRVAGNTFRNLRANAIRLLTDVGTWKEGVGAFNVIVSRNIIENSGIDDSLSLPWAAITAYGAGRGNVVSAAPVNRDLIISGNTITGAMQGCITIASSRNVEVSDNACNSTNLQHPSRESLNVLKSEGVVVTRNTRTGRATGGIAAESATTSGIDVQSAY